LKGGSIGAYTSKSETRLAGSPIQNKSHTVLPANDPLIATSDILRQSP
jgi:hypothetical protein